MSYATVDGTALAGTDYQSVSGTLTFAAGEISKTINVGVLDDVVYEDDEIFTVELYELDATLGVLTTAEITIQDNDQTAGDDGGSNSDSGASSGGGLGCTINPNPNASPDPVLPLLVLLSVLYMRRGSGYRWRRCSWVHGVTDSI